MVKKFTIPFASQGDANDIPDALQVDGKVSFTQGFGYDYERPYDDPQAKDIAREDMNGLFKAITSAVGELQTLGASEWSDAIAYPKGAIVYFEKDLYISQVDDNQNTPPQSWVSITSIANDSLKKAANLSDLTNKTTARNNLGLGSSATLNKTDVLGTSTSLVATQKLVNDTKINLENSKQDKLTFTGTGNVARMSEVEKKMNNGAHGLGSTAPEIDKDASYPYNTFLSAGTAPATPFPTTANIINLGGWEDYQAQIGVGLTTGRVYVRHRAIEWQAHTELAIRSEILGVDQEWRDVTNQRAANVSYKNSTGKPIEIAVEIEGTTQDVGGQARLLIGGIQFHIGAFGLSGAGGASFIIPNGESYQISILANAVIKKWIELRG